MSWWRLLFLLPAVLLLAGPAARAAAPAGATALLVVTGDQHSAYERTAHFVALVDRLRAEHPGLPLAVLLNGDTLEYGNVLARRSHGAADFAAFAALARRVPTVLNLGNHEPEFYDVAETVRRITATGVQVVSNLRDRATGQPFAPAARTLTLGTESFVLVGFATDRLATYRVAVRPALDADHPVVWARAHLPALLGTPAPGAPAQAPPAGALVLSHAGLAADREILPLVPDGTLFAGAHDHLRLVEQIGRTAYFHTGAWNEAVTLAWRVPGGADGPRWVLEQVPVPADGPADAEVAAALARVRAEWETPEDRAVVGRTMAALDPATAARLAAEALRTAAGADAAFIGHTTFGGGLPAGEVSRLAFDACVRFDGAVFTAEVDGARLARLLAAADPGPETPFAQRLGEFNHAAGPAVIDPARRYRIATTDWGARNTARYFGAPELAWRELPGVRLKAAVLRALAPPPP